MKINEVLECINKVSDSKRENTHGHLIAVTEIKKSMGPYRQAYTHIYYIDLDKKDKYEYCTASIMDRCTKDKEDKLKERCEKEALIKLFSLITVKDNWEKLITGEVW